MLWVSLLRTLAIEPQEILFHTFSIAAIDPETGVAVSTAMLAPEVLEHTAVTR